ncbi:Hpt domain-containing protein [Providencia heimbachae]
MYQGEGHEKDETSVDVDESILDIDMLEQYLELVGPKLIYDGLDVFEKMLPGYLAILDSNMVAKDQKGIVEEGHKIKGAAGSIGLKNLQKIAQQIQSPDLPAWWDNVQEWVDELKQDWKKDIETLRNWVDGRTKK